MRLFVPSIINYGINWSKHLTLGYYLAPYPTKIMGLFGPLKIMELKFPSIKIMGRIGLSIDNY